MNPNNYNNHRNSNYDIRISVLAIGYILIIIFFTYMFFSKSILDHDKIIALAQEQYIVEKDLPSSRGIIFAVDNNKKDKYYPLALNENKYEVLVVPKNIKGKESVADKLAQILKIDSKELFEKINNDKLYIPPIAKNIDKDLATQIINLNIQGVLLLSNEVRIYPEDNLASQIIGFVDAEGEGRYGLEGYYNNELKGIKGEIVGEKDILGRLISVDSVTEAKNGANLYLTIDRNIQYMATKYLKEAVEEMKAEKGQIIIIDPKTGNILSMAGLPDYNPNTYYETAKENIDYFLNPIISKVWEPGSIMKPIVMSMAINDGKVEPDTQELFGGYVNVNGYEIKNAMNRSFGRETMTQVLENSDNVAMVWVSGKFSYEEMRNYFQKFSFDKITDIDLDGETSGYLLELENWRDISKATMAFGQGISVTPLQMVLGYCAIANEGVIMKPRLVEKIEKTDGSYVEIQTEKVNEVISKETANKLKVMLISTVEKGYDMKSKIKGYTVAGKTGTAQVAKEDGGYSDDKFIHSFAGFAPADDPKFVMLIILENPKKHNFASDTTTPLFSKLSKWILNYYNIKPQD